MLALPGRTGAFPRLRFTFRGTRRAALAELLAQHLALDLLHVAARQLAELEGAVAGADQPVDGPAEMFADLADLAVLALGQRHRHPGVVALLAVDLGVYGALGDALDRPAAPQRPPAFNRNRVVEGTSVSVS